MKPNYRSRIPLRSIRATCLRGNAEPDRDGAGDPPPVRSDEGWGLKKVRIAKWRIANGLFPHSPLTTRHSSKQNSGAKKMRRENDFTCVLSRARLDLCIRRGFNRRQAHGAEEYSMTFRMAIAQPISPPGGGEARNVTVAVRAVDEE